MNLRIFTAGLAASLALAAPAVASDRSGTAHFDTRFGEVTSVFEQSFDPQAGVFARTGTITLRGDRTLTYTISATCRKPQVSCDFTGSATGPFGGKWRATGTLTREANGVHLAGQLTTPAGRSIDFDRHASDHRWLRQGPAPHQDTAQ